VAAVTGLINVLALAGSFYLVAVYDCVLPAQNASLLIGLSLGAAGLHIIHGLLDVLRSRVLSRSGGVFHAVLRDDVFAAIQLLPLRVQRIPDPILPVRDLDQVRASLSGAGAAALLDLVWVPAYLAAVYFLNPALGLFALGGAILVASLALLAVAMTAGARLEAAKRSALRLEFCETVVREAKAARAMRLGTHLQSRWRELSDAHAAHHQIALDAAGAFAGASKAVRMIVQSGILGFGAYLLMRADISAGAMMAASILMSRALAPIEAASMHWRSLVTTRQSYRRLCALFKALEAGQTRSHPERVSWVVSTGCFSSPSANAGQSGAETTF
jgi:ATP-binding cassette subfamily C protein